MPLFRFHRGGLIESLKTTVIVKDLEELKEVIMHGWINWLGFAGATPSNFKDFDVQIINPFDSRNVIETFDPRCGWYTHYVSTDILEKGKFLIEGFISEHL